MKTVLIVEDDFDLREIMIESFPTQHFSVQGASNGQEALDLLEKATFDMIVSDVQMPILDGMDFLRLFKAKYKSGPKFLVMTGGCSYSKADFLLAGADGFFDKPLDINKLISIDL